MNKKLQIFVSSTYTDLINERQAAVEAILACGHIPAGMELFQAGNMSQWETIKHWIKDSDIYMLILGGRYGSIEPLSGKSYIQLEYEYAISQGIPVFSIVLTDLFLLQKANLLGKDVYECNNPAQYKIFKQDVLSKIVKFANDEKDIQIAIMAAIQSLSDQYDLKGWIKAEYDIERLETQYSNLQSKYNTLSKAYNKQRTIINKIRALIEPDL